MVPNGVLLYLDEIQSFNKKQQQSLLEHIENGKITLIASTTENPYFYVFNAILSRSTVFEFKQISASAALQAVRRAVSFMEQRTALTAVPEDGALEYIASSCGGDLRKAMNAVEVLFSAGIPQDGKLPLTLADAKEVTQKSALRADRDGDNYYDLLSALHKSIRGSDPDAACHYLARLLEAGQVSRWVILWRKRENMRKIHAEMLGWSYLIEDRQMVRSVSKRNSVSRLLIFRIFGSLR